MFEHITVGMVNVLVSARGERVIWPSRLTPNAKTQQTESELKVRDRSVRG
jgi:hypothetical protein